MVVDKKIVVFVGGVGGVKLALGLSQLVQPENLTLIVNTGDDFWHLGLKICPDIDTVMYTLAGIVNPEQGWGLKEDSTITLDTLNKHYQIEPWFKIGDKDLATHILRTSLLQEGYNLTDVTHILSHQLGVKPKILPMCDEEVPTIILTNKWKELGFQEYFVKYRWQPIVRSIRYQNHEQSTLSDGVKSALELADVILFAPSNPWLSITPILSVPGMKELLRNCDVPRVAITPVIGGAAVKGPTAKIMEELGLSVTADTVAQYYGNIINGFVNDIQNEPFEQDGLRTTQFDTWMRDLDDKVRLAQSILDWIGGWGR